MDEGERKTVCDAPGPRQGFNIELQNTQGKRPRLFRQLILTGSRLNNSQGTPSNVASRTAAQEVKDRTTKT